MANANSLLAEKKLFFARLANLANSEAKIDAERKNAIRLANAKGWLTGANRVVATDLDNTPYTLADFNAILAAETQLSNVASGAAVTALDVLGAVGAARTIAYAVLAGQPVLSEPSQQFLETGIKEPGEPHSSYHEYLFKLRRVKDLMFTQTGKRIAKQRDAYLRGFYTQLQAECRGER